MALKHVQETYEAFGKEDPFYAVLSTPEGKGGNWDKDAFFGLGREEIQDVLDRLAQKGIDVARGSAMDFGCGVGRLTQALGDHFDTAVGVDISSTMVATAEAHNRHGDRCTYVQNTRADLSVFGDASFDFIYTNMALQHSPPEASRAYVADFFRILKPGGVAWFQLPSGRRHEPGSLGDRWYHFRRGTLRRGWKRLRGKLPVEVHYVNHDIVARIVRDSGGTLLEAWQEGTVRRWRESYHYIARRDGGEVPPVPEGAES